MAAVAGAVGWKAIVASVDFPIYYAVGEQVRNGNYELYPAEVYEPNRPVGGHGYRYLPAIALLLSGPAFLPYHGAVASLFVLKLLAFAHCIAILRRRLRLQRSGLALTWVILLTVGGFLVEEFRGGNLQFLVVYLLLVAFDQSERLRVLLPSAALALAIAIKVTPLAVLGYFAVRQKAALLAVALTLLAALIAVPAVVWGVRQNAHLLAGYRSYSTKAFETVPNDRNYSLRGVLVSQRPFGISIRTATVIWLLVSVVIGVAAVAVVLRPPIHWLARDVEFAVVLACIPLLSPHSQRIYFSYLLVPVAVLFALLSHRELRPALRRFAGSALASLALLGTMLPAALGSKGLSRAYLGYFPYTWGCAFVAAALLWSAFACRQRYEPLHAG
jgi:alpha-1,2-mannosyltransferase